MKVGTVALIGRPNSGKSTLVNNLVGRKVAITSPKPQTTQFPIFAVYDTSTTLDYEGQEAQIIFVDTPGVFGKAKSARIEGANLDAERTINQDIDIVLYIIDHTRRRGREENKVLGMIRKVKIPKILVVNKIDRETPDYSEEYKFMEDEFDAVVKVSALKQRNLPALLEEILKYLKEGEAQIIAKDMPTPALNLDSKLFIAENIREKAFLCLHDELPYTLRVVVDEVTKRKSTKVYYIKARIITTNKRYRKMIIGEGARKIKQIGAMARQELEVATNQRVYLELTVEVEE
ncbi:MAG: GTPase Era [Candidatus Levybacteria bacterium CG10_big_fil_rev_8_21_14_0_10_36_7]|nr:MAG: GTPase Era [Candidatus Levybacteria bacterium CG10_big_fil_rev_8_21_14_0_10_36_7]